MAGQRCLLDRSSTPRCLLRSPDGGFSRFELVSATGLMAILGALVLFFSLGSAAADGMRAVCADDVSIVDTAAASYAAQHPLSGQLTVAALTAKGTGTLHHHHRRRWQPARWDSRCAGRRDPAQRHHRDDWRTHLRLDPFLRKGLRVNLSRRRRVSTAVERGFARLGSASCVRPQVALDATTLIRPIRTHGPPCPTVAIVMNGGARYPRSWSLRRSGGAQMLLGVGAALERSGPSGPTVRRDHADDLAPTFVPPVV